jgi:carbamoyl-phosphate synthase large subunit
MGEPFNILISSCGRRVALIDIFRRALEDQGRAGHVFGSDMSRLSAAYHHANNSFTVPPVTSDLFLPRMLKICREKKIKLIVPTIDPELPIYATAKEQFAEQGVTVGIGSAALVEIGSDKVKTWSWLTEHDFPTVRQADAAQVAANPEGWDFPLLVKPQFGSASIGVSRVNDLAQLKTATAGGGFVAQTIATGDEYTVDVFVDASGRCRCAVSRKRLEVRAGEVSKAVTVRMAPVAKIARSIAEALPGAFGVMCIQIFYDLKTGSANVIEINPRFGGGFPLTHQAGANMAGWLIELAEGKKTSANDSSWTSGQVMLRYDEAVFTDAGKAGIKL